MGNLVQNNCICKGTLNPECEWCNGIGRFAKHNIENTEQVYFISADRLKEDTVINENTDNKLINPTIIMVQDIYIQGIIGTSLYSELKTQVKAGSVTSLNQTLLNDYLQPAIKHYCMAELCLPLTYKFMNKSIVTKNSDNSTTATPEQLSHVKNYYLNHAEWYAKRIVKYLQENQSQYPLWLGGNTTIDNKHLKPKPMENTIPFTIEQWETGEYDAVLPTDKAPIQLQTTSIVIVESSPYRYITLCEPIYYADIYGEIIQYSRYGVPSDTSKPHLTLRLRPKIKTYYVNIHQNANGTYIAQMQVFTDIERAAKESTKAYAQGSKFIKTLTFEL